MTTRYKALFITIIPSPYQRDLFRALAEREDVELSVCYLEKMTPENPWPEKTLRPFERIVPGFAFAWGEARVQVNWNLPDISQADVVVLSSFTSVAGQVLMHGGLRRKPWLFWGERLRPNSGPKAMIRERLVAPLAGASGIVGIGRAARDDYQRRFPNVPNFCIPYHCDITRFLQVKRAPKPGAPLIFLFCGQIIARKGVDLLLLAFDRLVAKGLNVQLLLIGREAQLPEFMKVISPLTRSKVRYEGFQDTQNLPEYFGRSDVFVLPSRHDGWGVVLNQALAAGLPIITSDAVGAGLDLVENEFNGLRVPAGDVESLHRAMERMVLNAGVARQWGKRAKERARELTPELGAEKWARVFRSIQAPATG